MALDFISPNSLATSWAKHGHSFSLRIIRRSGREVARLGIPMIHHFGARDGMVIATLDEFTAGRRACLDYLLRMIRFSRYTVTKDGRTFHYFYRVVDKYIDTYRLLEVC